MPAAAPWFTWQPITLQLRNPFRLSYGVSETRRSFWLRLVDDEGWGEAAIPPYYGISDDAMIAYWEQALRPPRQGPLCLTIRRRSPPGSAGMARRPPVARSILPCTIGSPGAEACRSTACSIFPRPLPLPTSFTIAIAEPGEMARLAAEASRYPILKIKLGSDDDAARLAAIRAARPDAICASTPTPAGRPRKRWRGCGEIERFNLEMVEQPVARHDIAGMGYVQARTDLPIVADESVQTMADVEALAAAGVRGINLKLQKVGGLRPGVAMLRRAKALGLKVMLGCMIETSIGATAMAHLSGLADWLDLDAPLLIANDPFEGVTSSEVRGFTCRNDRGLG